jgi:hypothetical protein
VYVGSWGRSGSTLLDLILGQVSGFQSIGEVRYLWERGLAGRQRCGCGMSVPDCPFWAAVLEETWQHGSPRPGRDGCPVAPVDGLGRLPGSWHRAAPALERDVQAFREVLCRLYRAVRLVSGASLLVDSSKYASYGLLLAGVPEFDLRVLHLVRDSRAVAYSWLREKLMPEISTEVSLMPIKRPWRSAVFWDLENLGLHLLRRLARGYQVLRYDDLTARPCAVLSAALERVGIAADLEFLRGGRLDLGVNHTVAGTPIRFLRGEVPIQPDAEWRTRGYLGRPALGHRSHLPPLVGGLSLPRVLRRRIAQVHELAEGRDHASVPRKLRGKAHAGTTCAVGPAPQLRLRFQARSRQRPATADSPPAPGSMAFLRGLSLSHRRHQGRQSGAMGAVLSIETAVVELIESTPASGWG